MTKKIIAVTGEYMSTQDNQQKAEFTDIGIIGIGKNQKEYMLLDPSISLSGVLARQNVLAAKRNQPHSDMVMCSIVEVQQNQGGQPQGGYQQPQGQQQGSYQGNPPQQGQQGWGNPPQR